jgi:SAM-dependent methyltransferase
MEKEEYEIMFNVEDDHWWYIGLRDIVFSSIDEFSHKKDNLRILDAGCGTGKNLEMCKDYNVYGIDFSEEAIKFCKLRKINNLVIGSICDVPFKKHLFDIVISLDVICNVETKDDLKALRELYRIMNNNGILVLNLGAYNFLRSKHDQAVHIKHRYTFKELKNKIEKAGCKIEIISYRNIFLFPVAILKRIVDKLILVVSLNKRNVRSDLKPVPSWLNKLFLGILSFENKIILSRLKFPFGLSIYCVARKRV